jgi:putative flavoprotein involved in K+ transport
MVAADLRETLVEVDQFEIDTLKMVDEYIVRVGLAAPPEMVPQLRDAYEQEVITELNLEEAGISTIIWATGYSFDFSFVKLPVVDADGYPLQKRGVTEDEGLYFLGMPWLHSRRSGILFGVGDDAAYIAAHIAARARGSTRTLVRKCSAL